MSLSFQNRATGAIHVLEEWVSYVEACASDEESEVLRLTVSQVLGSDSVSCILTAPYHLYGKITKLYYETRNHEGLPGAFGEQGKKTRTREHTIHWGILGKVLNEFQYSKRDLCVKPDASAVRFVS